MTSGEWNSAEFGGLPSVVVAAHELKSPLALMRQLSLLLQEEALAADDVKQIAAQLSQVSDRALGLVGDLAQTANLSPALFPLEPVNPLALCREMAHEMRPMMQLYNRSISWPSGRAAGQLVVANRVLLGRVLVNFLHNALRYSEVGCAIEVTAKRRSDTMRLSVRDYGPMMSRREYRRLIDEMAQRKTVRTRPESSGLGVYVAAQFARAMGGDIGLIRHRDGLTFYIEVPLSRQMSLL